MSRKIVQITAMADRKELFALCDDGSVWRRLVGTESPDAPYSWRRIDTSAIVIPAPPPVPS